MGSSELGKFTRKFWKLRKVKTHNKYFKHKIIQFKCTLLCLKDSMALFFVFTEKKKLKTSMFVLNFQLRIFQDFQLGIFVQQLGKKDNF